MDVGDLLTRTAALLSDPAPAPGEGPWRVGVDLGTASCVLVVLDGDDEPVWADAVGSGALADGVVVDVARAVAAVAGLKRRAEEALGCALDSAATAHPPCIPRGDARACTYVCESAGFADVTLVDEVTAAARTLGVRDGVVVDVGGGSTGVGILRGGRVERVDDRPGGGHHLDLILAGAWGLDVAEAEAAKRARPEEALPVLTPGLHRIGQSILAMTAGAEELPCHLAGGALMLPRAGDVLAKYADRAVVTYPHALMITPIGIARSAP